LSISWPPLGASGLAWAPTLRQLPARERRGPALAMLHGCSREPDLSFRLTVQVLGAFVPGLEGPDESSGLQLQRPLLEVALGSTRKETELADFTQEDPRYSERRCPWKFSDRLTFPARADDILGPGLQLQLRVRKDVSLCSLKCEMRDLELAEGAADLRHRVLPTCVREGPDSSWWCSPALMVPLLAASGSLNSADRAVAQVAMAFAVDADPQAIITMALTGRWPSSLSMHLDMLDHDIEGGVEQWLASEPGDTCSENSDSVDASDISEGGPSVLQCHDPSRRPPEPVSEAADAVATSYLEDLSQLSTLELKRRLAALGGQATPRLDTDAGAAGKVASEREALLLFDGRESGNGIAKEGGKGIVRSLLLRSSAASASAAGDAAGEGYGADAASSPGHDAASAPAVVAEGPPSAQGGPARQRRGRGSSACAP